MACNPGFAQGANLRFERLAPGETRRIAPLVLDPNHEYLSNLNETQRASISVYAVRDGTELGRIDRPIEILAYDQWAGTRSLPELLAAFCMPNDPAVDRIVAEAGRRLQGGGDRTHEGSRHILGTDRLIRPFHPRLRHQIRFDICEPWFH